MSERIPAASTDLSGNEEKYVVPAIRSSWISSSGEFVDRFEQEFAAACDVNTAIGTCNGTMALHLALLALDVRPGDEVCPGSREKARKMIAEALEVNKTQPVPAWLELNRDTLTAKVIANPKRDDVPHPIQEQLIIELCSK